MPASAKPSGVGGSSTRGRKTAPSAEEGRKRQHAERSRDDADRRKRVRFRRNQRVRALRRENEQRIAGRMRLMLGDVEVPDAEREVDRIEIFQRHRKVRHMEGEKTDREYNDQRRNRRIRRKDISASSARSAFNVVGVHVGRRNNPSFRLPVRYPWRSRLTCV